MLLLLVLSACDPSDKGADPTDDTGPVVGDDTSVDSGETGETGGDSSETGSDTGETDTAETDTGETDSGETDSGETHSDTAETGLDTAETGETAETGDSGETGDTAAADPPPAVILFIGDGMGKAHVEGAGYFVNGAAGTLAMEGLPYRASLRTASFTGITDSAASATVMASGVRTINGYLGVDRDGADVDTVLAQARAAGMAVGVVSTDELTGATPSAFVVHVSDRADEATIADAWALGFPDVALGGGQDAMADLASDASYQVVLSEGELAAATPDGRPLLGVFSPATFPYVADGRVTEPGLDVMTRAALDRLDDDPEGFFLVVEGARIDHASHANDGSRVFQEVAELDEAVQAALDWAGSRANTTVLVTADHECGGLHLLGTASAGDLPPVEWRWNGHTNADVHLFGYGDAAAAIDGQRLSNDWVYAVLSAAIEERSVVAPAEVPVVDGALDDLGAPVTTQAWTTSFGEGYNQLDALRLTADDEGLRVGVDGVFEDDGNIVAVLIDLDFGDGTGFPSSVTDLVDTLGDLDLALSEMALASDVPGVGFDVVLATDGAEETWLTLAGFDSAGARGVGGLLGDPANFNWGESILNFDDGNVSLWDDLAPDADAAGFTEGGMEGLVPWTTAFPAGFPAKGTTLAVAVVLVNSDGDWISNQTLPPLAVDAESGSGTLTIAQVAVLTVDGAGAPVGPATLHP